MSSFQCDKCGADNIGTEQDYLSGCECYSNIDTLEDAVVAKANREMVEKVLADFSRWWYNQPGTNTDQGASEWCKSNPDRIAELTQALKRPE